MQKCRNANITYSWRRWGNANARITLVIHAHAMP
jgi:hypothetical protein